MSIDFEYGGYFHSSELTEKSNRVYFLTHPLFGLIVGALPGVMIAVVCRSIVTVSLIVMFIGMIMGPTLLHMYRQKKIAQYDEKYEQFLQAQREMGILERGVPVNSPKVCRQVRRLQPKLQKMVLQSYADSIRIDLAHIKSGASGYAHYVSSVIGRDVSERQALWFYDRLKEDYKDYLHAYIQDGPMSRKEEERYIVNRARHEMSRFGSCHRIWNTEKRILKEKYGIEWYTPDETQPDVFFD